MKHLKIYENFNLLIENFRFLDFERLENGNLKIILNSEGRKKAIEDGLNFNNFDDYFEDIRGNSEYLYWWSISDANLGMSEAPCITDGYYFKDDGKLTDDGNDDSEIFWYPDHIVKDFTEELDKNGYVIFITNKPKTKEEIEQYKKEKTIGRYNL